MKKTANHTWGLIWILAKTDFRLRYQGSWLGFVWVILKPLSMFIIMNFVFTNVFHGGPEFSIALFTGIILWNFFVEGTMTGMMSLFSKAHILTKIAVSKWIIVIASTLNIVLNFILNLIVLAVFYWYYGFTPSFFSLLAGLYYCGLIYLLILCISFFTAALFVRFRDLNQIWEVILTAGFYATPVIYPLSIMPASVQHWLYLNPMTFLIVHTESVLIHNQLLFPWHTLYFTLFLIVFLIVSLRVFQKFSRSAAQYL